MLVNLTPHDVNFIKAGIVVPASGTVARAVVTSKLIGETDGIPVYENVYGEVEGLPEPKPGVIYIVSALAAQAAKNRDDVYITNDAVRDENGRIIGCNSLAKL